MTEKGLAEGIERVDKTLEDRARRSVAAWDGAAITVAGETIDRTEPRIPRVTGELAGSGFVERSAPVVAGFGSDHGAAVHELAGGHGFKFYQRQIDADRDRVVERMGELHEEYTNRGVTAASAPCSWPSTPVTRSRSATTRARQGVVRQRAGAPRRR